jgi:DNA-binding transcriptional LysR family regulator
VDLVAEGFDVVVRIAASGGMPDSDLVSRKLVTGRMRLCASPGWVMEHGRPERVADLMALPCISFSHAPGKDRSTHWPIADEDERLELPISGPMRSDSGLALLAAVIGGAGIGLLPGFLVSRALTDGRLVELLPQARTGKYGVYGLRPPTAYPSPSATAVLDAMQSWLIDIEI